MMSLEGIRVLDWTIYQQGPVASTFLADLGADVIKIEQRGAGDPGRGMRKLLSATMRKGPTVNTYFETMNRNKRGIALDLRKDGGRQVVYRLVEKCDVFVHNFRKHVPGKLGVGYETLSRINPRLIYGVGSTFGPEGPEAGNPAVDLIAQARSGIMSSLAGPGDPPRLNVGGVADQVGGTTLVIGILAALIARDRTGRGQKVEASLLGSMCWFQGSQLSFALHMKNELKILDRKKARNPLWNHYPCKDGKWIVLAMIDPERYWADFCRVIGRDDLVTDPRCTDIVTRSKNSRDIVRMFDETFVTRPRDEWMRILKEGGDFIFDRVNTLPELAADPQVLANDYIIDCDLPVHGHVQIVGPPLHLSETPARVRNPAPALGQHTEEVLTEIGGYTREEIESLRADEVI
ncbi:CaiB/BaiF CoA transferase family protein [Thermodesulfobacteriota bacterium]